MAKGPPENSRKKKQNTDKHAGQSSQRNDGAIVGALATLGNTVANEAQRNRDQDGHEDDGKRFREWMTIGLLAVTAALVLIQACIFYETDITLKETMIASNRAWLAPGDIERADNFVMGINDYTELNLLYENVGKEPANRVNAVWKADIISASDFKNPQSVRESVRRMLGDKTCDMFAPNPNGVAVFPGTRVTTYKLASGLSKELVTKASTGAYYPIVAGCFTYETFGRLHRSEFCVIYEKFGLGDSIRHDWRTTACPVHNSAN